MKFTKSSIESVPSCAPAYPYGSASGPVCSTAGTRPWAGTVIVTQLDTMIGSLAPLAMMTSECPGIGV